MILITERSDYSLGKRVNFITKNQEELQEEFTKANVKIVRSIDNTDYNNKEFVIEDIDGRWIGFGIKVS
ncbi:hypothetical protein MKX79_15580 [Viridibacillus sp. FSL R5-0468]|uniref:hypothetical protein n=1 Tax=Viridibacillus sp. FSL R5-0468 TaxID=2921640 RepID=UPI0030FAF8D6